MRSILKVLTVAALACVLPNSVTAQGGSMPDGAEPFLGGWVLVEWTTTNQAGEVNYPYGENAGGQIVYTPNGRMSAQLMNPPDDPADEPSQFLSYWGGFVVDQAAGTVTHQVVGANRPNWIGSDQVRNFEFEGPDRLVLSVGGNRLAWERAR